MWKNLQNFSMIEIINCIFSNLYLYIETFITISQLLLYQEGISILLYGNIYNCFRHPWVITNTSYLLLIAAAHGEVQSCFKTQ